MKHYTILVQGNEEAGCMMENRYQDKLLDIIRREFPDARLVESDRKKCETCAMIDH